jgi:hypothetical protein
MIAALILAAAAAGPAHLEIQPWNGKDFVSSARSAAKFRLIVTGKPNARLHLKATAVADGWLGAFCTPKVCAPEEVDVNLPKSGRAIYQFELIKEVGTAPARSSARIVGDDGSSVDVPAATR